MNLYFHRKVQPNIQLTSSVNSSNGVFYLISMMTEAADSPRSVIHLHQVIQHHIPQDSNLHSHHQENLKSHKQKQHYSTQLTTPHSVPVNV